MRPIEILLVEDNAADVDLTRETLATGKVANNLHVVRDGEAALAFLRRQGKYAGELPPALVLLDINLRKKKGCEVLAEIKADPDLKRIPVVMLATSEDEAEILESYDLHANCYIIKPVDLTQFIGAVHAIEDFWLTVVQLPPRGGNK